MVLPIKICMTSFLKPISYSGTSGLNIKNLLSVSLGGEASSGVMLCNTAGDLEKIVMSPPPDNGEKRLRGNIPQQFQLFRFAK